MAGQRPPLNPSEPLVYLKPQDGQPGHPTAPFLIFMRGLGQDVASSPQGFETVAIEGRTSAIPTSAFPTDGDLSAGIYRVSWAAKVVTVAGVSSSFQVTISWVWKGVTQQWVGALMNGNLTTTYEADSVPLLYVDAATPVTYAVAYASNPAAAMAFDAFFKLERMGTV